jgi:hypothetical protein
MSEEALTQDSIRAKPHDLLKEIARRIVDFREQHLNEGSDYADAVINGQKPWAIISQCVDARQSFPLISGLPIGRLFPSTSIAGFVHAYPGDQALWAKISLGIELGAPMISSSVIPAAVAPRNSSRPAGMRRAKARHALAHSTR